VSLPFRVCGILLRLSLREMEKLRMPIIRKDPNFASNPFETIRTHAANTLVKQDEA
jgi:hypothetical protein